MSDALIDKYEQIDEADIRAGLIQSGKNSPYAKLLELAEKWRKANCEPVFLSSQVNGDNFIACVSRETFDKKRLN